MAAGEVARLTLRRGCQEWPQAREGGEDVAAVERMPQRDVHDVEEHRDLLFGRLRFIHGRPVGGDIGEPDVHTAVGRGHREDETARRPRDRDGERHVGVGEPRGIRHEVRATARTEADGGIELARPHPRRRDDDARRDRDLGARDDIAQHCSVARRRHRLDTGQDRCAVPGSRSRDGDDESRVVEELTVPPAQTAPQSVRLQRRQEAEHLVTADDAG